MGYGVWQARREKGSKTSIAPRLHGGRKTFFLCGLGTGLGWNWPMEFEDKHDISGSVFPPPLEGLF